MLQSEYTKWIKTSFPKCEITTVAELVRKSICVYQIFLTPSDTKCQIVRPNKVHSPILRSDQGVFFDKYEEFGCSPCEAKLKDNDIIYDISDPSTPTLFIDKTPGLDTYVPDGTMILRLKNKTLAQFLVWYISLEQVSLDIVNNHSSIEWSIETLEVPRADYFNDKTFVKLLEETADAENRIASNAEHMLERLRKMREDVVHEIPTILSDKEPMKK